MILALVAAVGGALAYGAGSVLQAAGARRAVATGDGVLGVVRQAPYVIGLACDLGGWLLSLLALRRLPLFAVQAILAGSVAVTVVLAAMTLGTKVRRLDVMTIGATLAALVVLSAAAGAESTRPVRPGLELALLIGVPLVAAGAVSVARWASPVATGTFGGVAFGLAALAARAVHTRTDIVGTLTQPLAVAILAYGIIGMLAYAHALEHEAVGPVTAGLWMAEIIVPGAVGLIALGDHVRRGWALPALVATAVAVAATAVLSGSSARALASTTANGA